VQAGVIDLQAQNGAANSKSKAMTALELVSTAVIGRKPVLLPARRPSELSGRLVLDSLLALAGRSGPRAAGAAAVFGIEFGTALAGANPVDCVQQLPHMLV
jgi:hypothetical protein